MSTRTTAQRLYRRPRADFGLTRRGLVALAACCLAIRTGSLVAMEKNGNAADETVDFERASLEWVTNAGSRGRWRIVSACFVVGDDGTATPRPTVLTPAVMAGDVYGEGRLPRDPAYSFRMLADPVRHHILRDGVGIPQTDSEANHDEVFRSVAIDCPRKPMRSVSVAELASGVEYWPLVARIEASMPGSGMCRIECPITHLNSLRASGGGPKFQIETGPVALPSPLLGVDSAGAGVAALGHALAFVFFNRLDRADLAVLGRTEPDADSRGFSRYARLDGITISVFASR